MPIQHPPRFANGCFAKAWIFTLELFRLFKKGDVLPNTAVCSWSLSGFTCQQRGCGKIESGSRQKNAYTIKKGPSVSLFGVFFHSRIVFDRGNPSSPERRAIFRLTLTWPHVNMLMLILYSLFSHIPAPHKHAYLFCMFSLALVPHLLDISHSDFSPLMKCTL